MTGAAHGQVDLATMLDDAAFMSLEHQVHVDEDVLSQLGEHRWDVDLATARFWFTGDRGTLECTGVHLLGSAAPGPRSWLWSWANSAQYPTAVTALAVALREYGQQNGIAQLASAEVPFDQWPGSPAEAVLVAAAAAEAAKAFSGRWVHYTPAANSGGTRVALLLEHPSFALPPLDPARLMRVLTQGLQTLQITDHRRALNTYAHRRGLQAVFEPDGSSLLLVAPGFSATVTFDGQGRAANLSASAGPS